MRTKAQEISLFIILTLTSVSLHSIVFWRLHEAYIAHEPAKKPAPVKFKIAPPPPKKPPIKKPIPPKPKKIVKQKPRNFRRKRPSKKRVEAVQGLNKSSFIRKKARRARFKAPVGNTLFTGDKGIRRRSVERLNADLSRGAKLVYFRKPEYTDAAIDNELEGRFVIDVFVDESGRVVRADIRKKIGYGMDARLRQAALAARFQPRRNPVGTAISGWTEIKILLTLP